MSITILSYFIRDDRVIVRTDNPGRPNFNYSKFKFSSVEELLAEINRSVTREVNASVKLSARWDLLEADFTRERINMVPEMTAP